MEQMYVIDWPHLWRLNQMWRKWMEENSEFVTPDTIDTLRYCRIECNEAADVELRNRLSKHPRNNGRDNTVHEELADALMLALTAMHTPKLIRDASRDYEAPALLDLICEYLSRSVRLNYWDWDDGTQWFNLFSDVPSLISSYPGMNTEAELRKCWHRLAWKHASKNMDSYPEELKLWT